MRDFFFFRPTLGSMIAGTTFFAPVLCWVGVLMWRSQLGDEPSDSALIAMFVTFLVSTAVTMILSVSWFDDIKNSSAYKNKAGYTYNKSSSVVSSTRLAALNAAQTFSGTITGLYVRTVDIDSTKYFVYMAATGNATEHGQEYVERRIEADDVRIFEKDDATEATLKTIEDKVIVTRISDGMTRTITDKYRAFIIPTGSINRSVSVM